MQVPGDLRMGTRAAGHHEDAALRKLIAPLAPLDPGDERGLVHLQIRPDIHGRLILTHCTDGRSREKGLAAPRARDVVGWVRRAGHDAHHLLRTRRRAVTHRHLAAYAPPLLDVRAAPSVQGGANPPYEDRWANAREGCPLLDHPGTRVC